MIFVVCGTQKFPLNRLLEAVDGAVENGVIEEEVVVQAGSSDYPLRHCRKLGYIDKDEFDDYIARCSLLITHSGIGTILTGKNYHKPIIVFPRSRKYGEHVDDHQWQIAQEFAKRKMVLLCRDQESMTVQIKKSRTFTFADIDMKTQNGYLAKVIEEFVETGRKRQRR